MRGKLLAVSLVILVGGGSVGCKTMPNMAWWKTAKNDAPEATVLAHSAPALPSEIAKQAEGVASNANGQLAGSVAAPFVPSTTTPPVASVASAPGPYPSTQAPSFTPTAPATAVPAAPATANLGSLAMPYNPNAVPPAAAAVAPVAAPANVNRYAAASTSGSGTKPPATAYPSTASRYAEAEQVAVTPSTPNTTPTQEVATSPTAGLGGRYAQTPAASMPTAGLPIDNSLAVPATPASVPVTVVAETSPYRPGGTSTYPGASSIQSPVQVASRPGAPVANATQVPNSAIPGYGSQPAVPVTPQVPRYR